MKQARASLEAGNLGLAEKQFRELTRRDPLDAEPFHMLALIAYQGGSFAAVVKHVVFGDHGSAARSGRD